MKKLNLNLYESPYPPTDTNVLWVDVNESTGDIATIKKFENGEWVPCLTQGEGGSNPGDDLAEGFQYIEESFESTEPLTIKLQRTGEYGEYVDIEVWVKIPDFKYNYSGKDLRSNNSVYVGEITSRPDNSSYGGYIEVITNFTDIIQAAEALYEDNRNKFQFSVNGEQHIATLGKSHASFRPNDVYIGVDNRPSVSIDTKVKIKTKLFTKNN